MSIAIVFGRILQEKRQEKGLSQEQLAQLCGLDRTYISLLERGLRQPTLNSLFSISKGLGISPCVFIELLEKQYETGN
jgi:transcriptional regulator with XRE-family HTH domain